MDRAMIARWRRRLDVFLDAQLGARCAVTGDRVYPRDRARHQRDEHPDRGRCV